MSNWKVFKTKIKVFKHPDPETTSLDMGIVGNYSVVIQKNRLKDGDDVLFVPEKSILTGALEAEFKPWLVGKDTNRIKSKVMRGVESAGIILSQDLVDSYGVVIADLPYDTDVSELFGITKYVPPVPTHLDGLMEPLPDWCMGKKHDVERHSVYSALGEYDDVDRVIVSEKIHGSQINTMFLVGEENVEVAVTTKNKMEEGLCYIWDDKNAYCRGVINTGLKEIIQSNYKPGTHVQVIGELIPVAGKGYNYGQKNLSIRVFLIYVDGCQVQYDKVPDGFKNVWVPILYDGPVLEKYGQYAVGKESVSGQELHIREGCVVTPYLPKKAQDGFRLYTKVINPAYKETGEEIN